MNSAHVRTATSRRLASPAKENHRVSSARPSLWKELFGSVEWTLGYVSFLYYVFVIITFWLPFADVAIIVAMGALLVRPQDWRMSPSLWLFAAFAVWCVLSYIGSSYKAVAWQQTNELLKLWLVCLTAMGAIRSRAQLTFFLTFSVVAFVAFPLRGAFVNYFGGYNVLGRALWNFAYSNPNDLAAYALLFASMTIAVFFSVRNRLFRLCALGTCGLLLLLVLFTQSRGAMIAAAVVGLLFLVANRRNGRVLLGATALALVAGFLAPRSVWERIGGLANASVSAGFKGVDQERSAEQRFQLLTIASRVAKDNIWLGVGPGVYSIVHGQYARTAKGEMPLAGGNRDPHNTIMRTAAETGVVGLVLFLTVIGQALYRARRRLKAGGKNPDPVVRFLAYGVIAFMVAGLFGSFTYLNVLYLQLTMLEVAMMLSSQQTHAAGMQPLSARPMPHRQRRAILPGR
jgi:O-antigen ligase